MCAVRVERKNKMNRIEYSRVKAQVNIQGDDTYEIILNRCEEVCIHVNENIQATLLLKLENIEKVNIIMEIAAGAKIRLLHHFSSDVILKEEANLFYNATLESGFYILDDITSHVYARYYLKDKEAEVNLITSTIASEQNEFDVECVHEVGMTSSHMENYAICKESGKYKIVASGKIKKGARGSKSHQSTRVLTMGEKQNASVTPLLLIDENDVEASHASALGAMNEDHLYYLQTRGLNETQALGLLTLSYVLPILRIVENSDFHQEIEKEIESKVGLTC